MTQSEKTLSTQWIKAYRIGVVVLATGYFGLYIAQGFRQASWVGIAMAVAYFFLLIRFWYPSFTKFLKGLRQLSYDQDFLYINDPQEAIQIPLEHIRNVDLISLDGIYRFQLSEPVYFGQYVYCKPSLWYPFNYSKVDQELNHIRKLIRNRKEAAWNGVDSGLKLTSNNK